MAPKTRYARRGELNLAYQVVGDGPVDVVVVPSFVSHIEFFWVHPHIKAWLDQMSTFSRLILFDKAGTGLSDPVVGIPTLEDRAEEIEAVMDAAEVERAALFGLSEGGPASIFFAASRPERVQALVLFGTYATGWSLGGRDAAEIRSEMLARGFEEEFIPSPEQLDRASTFQEHVLADWGEGKALACLLPSQRDLQQLALIERVAASPGMARATLESGARLDVSDLLPTLQLPTLVVHARDDLMPIQSGRFLADRIPNASLLEVEGADHAPWFSEPDRIVGEIEQFLTGSRHAATPDRVVATVLFTDIVGSTERAAELGDARWRAVLERQAELTRSQVESFGGKAVKSTGDGYLATFEGPAQAIRCTEAIVADVRSLGIEIRAGIHTGECEVIGEDVGGLAVHIAARVNALAGPGEILVSRTVRDLVVGSGTAFQDRGEHELKGVPGRWDLLAIARSDAVADSSDREVTQIATPGPREDMRVSDRVASAAARRAPAMMRTMARLSERRQRARS